jgi:hypothetical protein
VISEDIQSADDPTIGTIMFSLIDETDKAVTEFRAARDQTNILHTLTCLQIGL